MKSNTKRLYDDVHFLTSITPARNYQNIESLEIAANYIYDTLSELAFDRIEYQPFSTKGGKTYKNVSALYKGESNERIIIGAHYDVWDNQPGADDNASAVAGLLETARLLHQYQKQNKLKYTLEFVGYCLEEPPFFATDEMGSTIHARSMHENNVPIQLMICYEMIGYFSDEEGSQEFPHPSLKDWYPSTGNFIIVGGKGNQQEVAEQLAKQMQPHCHIPVYPIASPLTDGLVNLSDHRSYWKYNYNAVMINDTSFMRNPNYHKKTDTIDTLDFHKLGEVVNGVAGALISINKI